MATLEGSRASAEFVARNLIPDFCKAPVSVVGFQIASFFDCAVNFSTDVRFRKQWAFHEDSRLSTVIGNKEGVGGGILSGVNFGFCRPIDGTSSSTVRVNGSFVCYHEGTYVFMNCAGPEGPWNTIGKIYFLGNMLPGPVSPSCKIPKSSFCGFPDVMSDLQNSVGSVDKLVKNAQLLYDLAQTDWSNPSAVLGAIGGVAGIAGLQDVQAAAKKIKKTYDAGQQLMDTDWSDPKQALAAVAGAANVANMPQFSQAAGMASTIRDTVRADWSDPRQAFASATTIMQTTGMNEMAAQMSSNAFLDSNLPVNTGGKLPPMFPPPGSANNAAGTSSNPAPAGRPAIPPSTNGRPRGPVTPEFLDHMREHNQIAYDRFNGLSAEEKSNAFVEVGKPGKDRDGNDYSEMERTAIYLPGEGFASSHAEFDRLWNASKLLPDGFTSLFVAGKNSPSIGNFFGIEQKDGNAYLFGGLVDLGSPKTPGAGTASTWWVPDRILHADMSRYFDFHDRDYYGNDVRLSDLGQIFRHEWDSLRAGATFDPLQLPIQALYSAATTTFGVSTATYNSVNDFFSEVFGKRPPTELAGLPGGGMTSGGLISGFLPGGCMPDMSQGDMGTGVPGTGGCFPGTSPTAGGSGPSGGGPGSPPTPATAGAPGGNASGAGTDGILITTAAGNPTAAKNAILAEIKAANDQALAEAREKERQEAERIAAEKAEAERLEADGQKKPSEKTQDDSEQPPPGSQKESENTHTPLPKDDTTGKLAEATANGARTGVEKGLNARDELERRRQIENANSKAHDFEAAAQKAEARATKADQDHAKARRDAKIAAHSGDAREQGKSARNLDEAAKNSHVRNAQANNARAAADDALRSADKVKTNAGDIVSESRLKLGKAGNAFLKHGGVAGDIVEGGLGAYQAGKHFEAGETRKGVGQLGETGGSLLGGIAAGAASGAAVGLACGPGAPVCSTIGGATGAILGGFWGGKWGGQAGRAGAETGYDYLNGGER